MSTTASTVRPLAWVRPLALKSIVGALIAAALVGVVSAITGDFGTVNGQALATVGLFTIFAFMSWYDADVSGKRAVWFGATSLAVTAYLLIAGVVKIWFPYEEAGSLFGDRDFVGEFFAWLWLALIARVALLHVHLLLFVYRKYVSGGMRLVAQATFALVGVLAIMLSLPALFRAVDFSEGFWRTIAVVAILDSLGTILVPLVYSLFHRGESAPAVSGAYGAPAVAAVPASVPASVPVSPLPGRVTPPAPGPAATLPASAAAAPSVAPAPAVAPPGMPPAEAYAAWVPGQPKLRLKWPQYEDGRPLPRKPDGSPDFTGVIGF